MPGRVVVAVVSVALAAVLALDLRTERDFERAQDIVFRASADGFPPEMAADVENARGLLERADSLRPGTTATVLRAFLEQHEGRSAVALELAREATRREPDNAATWHALLSISPGEEERMRARAELRRLDPYRYESGEGQ